MKINWFRTVCLLLAVVFTIVAIQGMFSDFNALSILPALASIGLIIVAVFMKNRN